jgi:hypothetical protein
VIMFVLILFVAQVVGVLVGFGGLGTGIALGHAADGDIGYWNDHVYVGYAVIAMGATAITCRCRGMHLPNCTALTCRIARL